MTARVTLKVEAVRAFLDTVPKTAEFKSAKQVLKKSVVNYENETDPTKRDNLKDSILRGVEALKKRMHQ